MQPATWNRIKQEWPLIFTASAVSMLSTILYQRKDLDITTGEFWNIFGSIAATVLVAIGLVYLVLFLIYKYTN